MAKRSVRLPGYFGTWCGSGCALCTVRVHNGKTAWAMRPAQQPNTPNRRGRAMRRPRRAGRDDMASPAGLAHVAGNQGGGTPEQAEPQQGGGEWDPLVDGGRRPDRGLLALVTGLELVVLLELAIRPHGLAVVDAGDGRGDVRQREGGQAQGQRQST